MADLSRESFDLSGSWQIRFDPDEVGTRSGWADGQWPEAQAQPIPVPGIWNVPYPDADGVGFYRTTFTPPEGWTGKAILLCFEGAIYRCEAWLNGTFIGSHEGGYSPFELDVTGALRHESENVLVVRVMALSKKRLVDGMAIQHYPLAKQTWYYPFGGIWGKVTLETRPWVAVQHAWVTPNLQDETASLELGLYNRQAGCRQVDLDLTVRDPLDRVVFQKQARVAAPPGQAQYAFTMSIPNAIPWSCEQPALYRLEVTARHDGGDTDTRSIPFGMRDFTVRDGQFYLNGELFYVRGVLFQPYYPVHLLQPSDPEEMERDIRLVKDAGFNLIRFHLNSTPPGFLDLADRMGVLVYAETNLAWIRDSPRATDHGKREIKALVERDRNHPSVVFWGIYNENPPMDAAYGDQLAYYTRGLDPTRVVVRNSGASLAIDQDFGWIDRGRVVPAREGSQQPILDVHLYLGCMLPNPIYDWLQALGSSTPSTGLAEQGFGSVPVFEEFDRVRREYLGKVFVSEIGCGGLSDLDDLAAGFGKRDDLVDARELIALRDDFHRGFEKRRLDQIFGSTAELSRQALELQAVGDAQQVEAVITNPRTSGYVITQWTDISWEFQAGLLDYWRRPKPVYHAVKRLNQPNCLIVRSRRTVVAQGETVEAAVTLVNREPLEPNRRVTVTVCDPEKRVIAEAILDAPVQPGAHALGLVRAPVGDPLGTYTIQAVLSSGDPAVSVAEDTVLVLAPVAWDARPPRLTCLGRIPPAAPLFAPHGESAETSGRPVCVAPIPESLLPTEWDDLFRAVEDGGAAILGALRPEHRMAQSELQRRGLDVQIHPGLGSWLGCHHWIPESNLFAGLPGGRLASKPYVDVLPRHVLSEMGGEVLAGSLRNTQSREEPLTMRFYSDIETVPLGKGTVTFCQYRVFDDPAGNPLAGRLAMNLLRHLAGLS